MMTGPPTEKDQLFITFLFLGNKKPTTDIDGWLSYKNKEHTYIRNILTNSITVSLIENIVSKPETN